MTKDALGLAAGGRAVVSLEVYIVVCEYQEGYIAGRYLLGYHEDGLVAKDLANGLAKEFEQIQATYSKWIAENPKTSIAVPLGPMRDWCRKAQAYARTLADSASPQIRPCLGMVHFGPFGLEHAGFQLETVRRIAQ